MVEDIISCNVEKDESLQILVIKLLVQLSTHYNTEVHQQLLVTIINSLIGIYSLNKNLNVQNFAKQAIYQVSCHIFARLEEADGGETTKDKAKQLQQLRKNARELYDVQPPEKLLNKKAKHTQNQQSIKNMFFQAYDYSQEYYQMVLQQKQQVHNCIDTVCLDAVVNLVDNVCLFDKKVEIVNEIAKENQEIDLNLELNNIPLNPVPYVLDSDDIKYRKTMATNIENEKGEISGDFGWCSNCRKKADFFCKDNRLPVCSMECKKEYNQNLNLVSRTYEEYHKISKIYELDAQALFINFCKVLKIQIENNGQNGTSSTNSKAQQLQKEITQKKKLIVLEILNHVFNYYKTFFVKHQKNQLLIKSELMDGLFTCCLNSEQDIFIYAVNVFWVIVDNYKENVKHEIAIFIKEIFLKLLNSNNSSHPHREMSLKILKKILQTKNNLLEFYINYDCSPDGQPLIESIMETLNNIANGMYSDSQYQLVISQPQQVSLQQLAIVTISVGVQALSQFYDEYEKNREIEESKKDNLDDTLIDAPQQDQLKDIQNFDTDDPIEKQRIQKVINQTAIKKFNQKAKIGIKYMQQVDLIPKNNFEKELALFLSQNNVDKEKLGAFIGGHDDLNIQVLTEFTNFLDLANMNIEQALRYYLTTFELPGEAQQVDRIVQKFGEKYQKDNENEYNSSDGVYTLSFLLIMLQTDLHNPQVVDKMTTEAFIKLAQGIEGETMNVELLKEIYQSIKQKPLAIPQKQQKQGNLPSVGNNLRKKKDMFVDETKQMLERGQELINNSKREQSIYYKANENAVYYIKPLMESVTKKIMTAFQNGINDMEPKVYDKSIEGFANTIKLATLFGLNEEKEILMVEFYKYSNLKQGAFNLKQLNFRRKNFKVVKALIDLANSSVGLNLGQSWIQVLECCSLLDGFKLLGKKDEYKEVKGNEGEIQINIQFNQQIIDTFYGNSQLLDDSCIEDFINALCSVSKQEIQQYQIPSIYSLQKIVEVAGKNLSRINIVWNKIWKSIRDHFSDIGVNANEEICKCAIKFLTELSIKFLQTEKFKEEQFKAQLQKEFLKPYETIFSNLPQQNSEIKIYILGCIKIISSKYHSRLKSGWRIIFNVINYALNEEDDNISQRAYLILKDIMEENLDNINDVFHDLVASLKKLSKKRSENLAFASIAHVKRCLIYLSEKEKINPLEQISDIQEKKEEFEKKQLTKYLEVHWMPLLDVLSNLCGDSRPTIQENAIESLFEILQRYGYCFSVEFWKMIFQGVLRPLFDEIIFTVQNQSKQGNLNWLRKSCQNAFTYITDLMDVYYDNLRNLVKELIKTYEGCIQNANESLVKLAISCLKNTLLRIGNRFTQEDWDIVLEFFQRIFRLTTPSKLIDKNNGLLNDLQQIQKKNYEFKFNCEECVTQCVAQLLLISVVKDMVDNYIDQLDKNHLYQLEQLLNKSYEFARDFNNQLELRLYLWKNGFMAEMKQLPGLLKQEREAQASQLILQFHFYRKYENEMDREKLLENLQSALLKYMQIFLDLHLDLVEIVQEKQTSLQEDMYIDQLILRRINEIDQKDFPAIINRLDEIESERDANNMRTMMIQTILPMINSLHQDEIQPKLEELFDMLLECSQYSIARSVICVSSINEDLDEIIRALLKKFFKFNQNIQTQQSQKQSKSSLNHIEQEDLKNNEVKENGKEQQQQSKDQQLEYDDQQQQ